MERQMDLSAEQYKEIIQSLKAHGWERRNAEQRNQPRVGLRSHLSIRPQLADGAAQKASKVWLRDLSPTGIGIVHSQLLEEGTEFVAEFPTFNHRKLSVLYSVAHCHPLSKSLFNIGGRLKGLRAA
jgi:hypothetical protein